MILEEDDSLIRRETELSGFNLLMKPELLRKRLCVEPGFEDPDEFTGTYLRYKPGMNCLLRVEFSAHGTSYFAYAKAFGADAESKLHKAMELEQVPGPLGAGRFVLADEKILFSVFPNDSKLKSIARLKQPGFSEKLMKRLFKSEEDWSGANFQILNYKPERRLVVKITNQSGQRASLKFFSRTEFDEVRHFRKHMRMPSTVDIPAWIGGSKAHRAVAYSWLPGLTLREQELNHLTESTKHAGQAIARFHNHDQPRFKQHSRRQKAERLRSLAINLSCLLPGMEDTSAKLGESMAGWWRTEPHMCVPIHGDFYDKQVVINKGSASIIDCDTAHLGNPLSDLGCFIAHLERHAVHSPVNSQAIPAIRSALLKGYLMERPETDLSSLDNYVGLELFQLLHQPFRDRLADWPTTTSILLNRCANLFRAA